METFPLVTILSSWKSKPGTIKWNPALRAKKKFEYPFSPFIDRGKPGKVKGEKSGLKLSFTGKYIHDIVLEACEFDLGFPFAKNKENVEIKSPIIERLVIAEEMYYSEIDISHHRKILVLVTQFGKCEKILRLENVRDIVLPSVHGIARNYSISLVVKYAIQRGMALKKIKMDSGSNSSEEIIDEIIKFGNLVIGEDEMKKTEIFTKYAKDFHFVFSNEESFQKVQALSNKIEEYFRSPLRVEADQEILQNVLLGFSIAESILAIAIAGPK